MRPRGREEEARRRQGSMSREVRGPAKMLATDKEGKWMTSGGRENMFQEEKGGRSQVPIPTPPRWRGGIVTE